MSKSKEEALDEFLSDVNPIAQAIVSFGSAYFLMNEFFIRFFQIQNNSFISFIIATIVALSILNKGGYI